jgi:uncharacterized membrane protein
MTYKVLFLANKHQQRHIMLDFLRGAAVLLMIFFHLVFDLDSFRFIAVDFLADPFWYALPRFIVALFLLCVGMSLALAHKNAVNWNSLGKRLLKIGGWAACITVITYMFFRENFVFFGILHCIAAASFLGVFFVGRPRLSLVLGLLLIITEFLFEPSLLPLSEWLDVSPMDYIPLYPWFGVVLLGIFLESINLHKIPLKKVFPVNSLASMGRHSLKIYIIHRPVLFGSVLLLYKLKS